MDRNKSCPKCGGSRITHFPQNEEYICMDCETKWDDGLFTLVKYPDDATYFEENDIGYPSYEYEDNGARYVPEYDYIQHFKWEPEANSYFKLLVWPASQEHLPDENDPISCLNEILQDEKSVQEHGPSAVMVAYCNLNY